MEIVTIVAFAASLPAFRIDAEDLVRAALLAGLSVLYAEMAARIERMRQYLASSAHVTMTSVWAFTAVLVLPAAYAAILVAFLFAFRTWQRRRQRSLVPHRVFYSTATGILAALAASAAAAALKDHLPHFSSGGAEAIAVVAALIVYFGINVTLVLTTIYLAFGPVPLHELLPDREELGLEIGTLVLGILTAETIQHEPWLTPLVLVLMVLLQRSSLVAQLELAAATDAKTGLLNAAAWQELAQRELIRSQHDNSPCAVLLLDLDHFKNVNDTLGHLAGDSALRAIGDALKRELRGYDAVARFGGEEFVVFLNDLNLDEAMVVAERTLTRVRGLVISNHETKGTKLSLTASIGLATYPQHGEDLTDLLEAADVALYGAKRAGRDQVGLPPEPAPVVQPASKLA
ncbi:MAG: GGDEF domain-containing protein [Actinomycetota bacterium]|nr:GGDEF domain-containing protein [Actinomycetota bacterium]MDQ2955343.1 GGDEF domain-containing protein [Actinomycetota bacterium]